MASEPPSKVCTGCGIEKPSTDFSPHPAGKLGVRSRCKPCCSEQAMRWRDENPDRARDAHLRRTFGITLAEYDALKEVQQGVCGICGEPPRAVLGGKSRRQGRRVVPMLVVDHDHATGRIRGLLCDTCNKGIGMLRDDPEVLRAALRYLGDVP